MKSYLDKLPITAKIKHENVCQGVLWEFQQGPRVWTARQKRGLVVGGEFHARRLTEWEIKSSKWADFYHRYNTAGNGPENFIWVFLK